MKHTVKKPANKMQMGGKQPKKKTAMDAMKDLGKYISTGGLATEKFNPADKNRFLKSPKKKMGGPVKAKSGGSFPDLNKDGKVTKADVLVGRGVIKAKKGAALKKQAAVAIAMKAAGKKPKSMMKAGGSLKPVDKSKNPGLSKLPTAVRNKMGFQKTGGATKKCKYGCK